MGLHMNLYKRERTGLESAKSTHLGEWTKANQVHKWIMDSLHRDACDSKGAYFITKEQLEQLLNICKEVVEKSKIEHSTKVKTYIFKEGKFQLGYTEGNVIANPEIAMELLPPYAERISLGRADLDEFYIANLKHTIELLEKVLSEVDFSVYEVYYSYTL